MTWNVPLAKRQYRVRPAVYTYPWVIWTVGIVDALVVAFLAGGGAILIWPSLH